MHSEYEEWQRELRCGPDRPISSWWLAGIGLGIVLAAILWWKL